MFHLLLVFNSQMSEKQMWNSGNLSKDADHDFYLFLKGHSSTLIYQTFRW